MGNPDDDLIKRRGRLRRLFARRNVVGAVVGGGGALALGLGWPGSLAGFLAVRWLYSRAEQRVPFTDRVHIILMPSVAEVILGEHLYEAFLQEGSNQAALLPAGHKDTALVTHIAQRLVQVLDGQRGGGYQRHLRNFRWQVSVVDSPVQNAFVYPGGKIVVYTGLLELLGRDADLVAMVMGHEIAHALARHNTEKMGMGLAASLVMHMAATALGAGGDTKQQHAERQRQVATARQQRGYHRTYSRLVGAELAPGGEGAQHQPSSSHAAAAAVGRGPGGQGGAMGYQHYPDVPYQHYPSIPNPELEVPPPDPLPPWMSEQLLATLSRLLLELPFSRRAETEADLIGLKLMGLAGFNTSKGPEAFQRLAGASGGKHTRGHPAPGQQLAALASLGCTHPDSNHRAQLLQQELEWMACQRGSSGRGLDTVGTKTSYWAL